MKKSQVMKEIEKSISEAETYMKKKEFGKAAAKLREIARAAYRNNDKRCIEFALESAKMSKLGENHFAHAWSYYMASFYSMHFKEFGYAGDFAMKAAKFFEEYGYPYIAAWCYEIAGDVFAFGKNMDKSLEMYERAYAISKNEEIKEKINRFRKGK